MKNKLTSARADSKIITTDELLPSASHDHKPMLAEVILRNCTISPSIVVGENVPDEITFRFKGGSGWTNMGSYRMHDLFLEHLKKISGLEYEFSEICRDENEKKAFELAIEENCQSMGYRVVKYVG